ncbi:MAG: hypothetical protein J2P41_00135 [Blastocatellia bacterium]|nr:hypothetical protein [Blastocatellia bacterium]
MGDQKYDIEFITFSLGLVPISEGQVAINVSKILKIDRMGAEWRMTLDDDSVYALSEERMAELERTIRARKEAAKALEKENYKQTLKAQAEAVNELNAGVAAGGVILGGKPGGRFRQQ